MKRFYTHATAQREEVTGLFHILLDGRPVKTPARAPLAVPPALADAVVAEWAGQGERVDPATMPVTGFANATIDQVLPDVATFAKGIAHYATTDLLCYRADGPAELVAEQSRLWDPLLDWARSRYDVTFAVTNGIMPVEQPTATLERLAQGVATLDPWLLASLSTIVSIAGTLVGALALVEGATDVDALWTAVHTDEDWQARQWGEDAEAIARHAIRRAQFDDAARTCALLTGASHTSP